MTAVRGDWIFSSLTFESPCSAATDTAGTTAEISASPVLTCVTRVGPAATNRTSAPAKAGLPPQ